MSFEEVIIFVCPISVDNLLSGFGAANAISSDSSSKSSEIESDPKREEKKVSTFTCFDTSSEESISAAAAIEIQLLVLC